MTVQVTSGAVKQTVSASGTIEPAKSADLDFTVSGTVTEVYVAEGDRVHQGQRLAAVDDDALVASRDAAAASLSAAEEQLDEDRDNGASDVQLASDQSAILAAKATLAGAKQDVSDAVLRSTIDGTVASLDLAVGDVVSGSSATGSANGSGSGSGSGAGSSGGSGSGAGVSADGSSDSSTSDTSSAVTIVSTKRFVLDGTVSADDAPKVKKGLQAQITVSGASDSAGSADEPVYGTVTSVGLVASTSSAGAPVFPVTIEVTGKRSDLYAGTSATASITVKQRPDVISVMSRAIRTDGDTTYVEKLVDGKPVKTTVEVGEVYGTTTEIKKGLEAGDRVEVPGVSISRGGGSQGGSGRSGYGGFGTGGGFPSGGTAPDGFPGGGPVVVQR